MRGIMRLISPRAFESFPKSVSIEKIKEKEKFVKIYCIWFKPS
jgi:hypothetical protein